MSEFFKFELLSYFFFLFDNLGMLWEVNKSIFVDVIWMLGECGIDVLLVDIKYVLDGGFLLYKLLWILKLIFGDIFKMYLRYVVFKFLNCMVVFDGYLNGFIIKDVVYIRCFKGLIGCDVFFNENILFCLKKEVFLFNLLNK